MLKIVQIGAMHMSLELDVIAAVMGYLGGGGLT